MCCSITSCVRQICPHDCRPPPVSLAATPGVVQLIQHIVTQPLHVPYWGACMISLHLHPTWRLHVTTSPTRSLLAHQIASPCMAHILPSFLLSRCRLAHTGRCSGCRWLPWGAAASAGMLLLAWTAVVPKCSACACSSTTSRRSRRTRTMRQSAVLGLRNVWDPK